MFQWFNCLEICLDQAFEILTGTNCSIKPEVSAHVANAQGILPSKDHCLKWGCTISKLCKTDKTWSHLYSFYSIIRMGPDTTCRSLWSSETARLWPVSKKEVIYLIRCICRSKEPTLDGSFLLGTKLITNSILGICGITDHHVTMNKDLGEDRFWFEHFSHSKGKVSPLFYLTP